MTLPAVIAIFLFNYLPMYGVLIAFKSYKPAFGIWGSKWVGLKHFRMFFESVYAWRIIRNTLYISLYSFLFCFPAPIILALLLGQALCVGLTRNNAAIHDLLAGTVVVDMSSQTIFRSTEDLIAYQKQVAAERAARQTY
jgi:ABC-type polysaccharide transport system permease subunit